MGYAFRNLLGLLECSHLTDLNARNKSLTAKLLKLGYRYIDLPKLFSKVYRRHYELVIKLSVGLKTFSCQSKLDSNGD